MPSFWDLLPASGWPAQPFIAPLDPTQATPHSDPDAGSSDLDATRSPESSGILGQIAPLVSAPPATSTQPGPETPGPPPRLPPFSLAGALATLILLGTTTRTARPEDDEFHPQYVVRGGESSPQSLQANMGELSRAGLPGQYGMSSSSAPGLSVDQIAAVARYPHAKISYTIAPEVNALGYRVIPTAQDTNPLHASIVAPPGQSALTDAQAAALSALFAQHILPNLYQTPRQ